MRFGSLLLGVFGVGTALVFGADTPKEAKRMISMDECIEMALKNNFSLRIERHNVEQARLNLDASQTLYDPVFYSQAGRDRNNRFNSMTFDYNTDYKRYRISDGTTDNMGFGVQGQGPLGMTYNVPFDFTRTLDAIDQRWAGVFPTFTDTTKTHDQYYGTAAIELTQPLMKGFRTDQKRYTVMVNRKTISINEHIYHQRLMDVVSSVRLAYYDVISARDYITVQEKALELAEKLLADNKAKVAAGAMAPLDEKQAESQVALTQSDLLDARQRLKRSENALKNIIVKDLPEWKGTELVPSEQMMAVAEVFDVQESWRVGLVKRPDLAVQRADLEIRDLDVRYAKDQTKPDLRIEGKYGHTAINTGVEDILYDINKPNGAFYYYGVRLSFPWGNREAKYRYRVRKDQRFQQELEIQKLQQDIMTQIDDAISSARSSIQRVEATRKAREYAELALSAEQKKLDNGKSTSFFVLQFQRDLTTARSLEIGALTEYNRALANLARAEGTALDKLKINVEFK